MNYARPYSDQRDSFFDSLSRLQFVRASALYDPRSGSSQSWADALEATDAEVRAAISAAEETR